MQRNWKSNTAVFLTSQVISLFGSLLVQYAITWHITLTTQSGKYATLAIICGFLPTLFLSPFAGVWADRYNRKTLIILADAFIALCTLLLAIVYMAGFQSIWLLFLAMGLRSLGAAVQMPCVGAMLPSLVPMEHLTRVNGINSSIQSTLMLVAPMLSVALMGVCPLEWIFMIDVITAALAIATMFFFLKVPHTPREKTEAGSSYLYELKEGIRYIVRQPLLRTYFPFCAVFFMMMAPAAFLTPLQVARTFGEQTWRLGGIEVAFSVGMLLGGLVITAWGGMKNKVHTMVVGCTAMSLCTLALGSPVPFWVYLLAMAIFGLSMPIFNTPATVLLQERVAPEFLGRVFSVMSMISSSMMPLGMLFFGFVADIVAIEWLLLGTGTVLLMLTFAMSQNKTLVQAGWPMKMPEGAAE